MIETLLFAGLLGLIIGTIPTFLDGFVEEYWRKKQKKDSEKQKKGDEARRKRENKTYSEMRKEVIKRRVSNGLPLD